MLKLKRQAAVAALIAPILLCSASCATSARPKPKIDLQVGIEKDRRTGSSRYSAYAFLSAGPNGNADAFNGAVIKVNGVDVRNRADGFFRVEGALDLAPGDSVAVVVEHGDFGRVERILTVPENPVAGLEIAPPLKTSAPNKLRSFRMRFDSRVASNGYKVGVARFGLDGQSLDSFFCVDTYEDPETGYYDLSDGSFMVPEHFLTKRDGSAAEYLSFKWENASIARLDGDFTWNSKIYVTSPSYLEASNIAKE